MGRSLEMATMAEPQKMTLNGYVGFDSITRQIEKKLLKRGFQFNVIVVGQTGLGKSTLINTIFAAHLIDSKGRTSAEEPFRQTTEIQTVSHLIEENGIRLRLNIVDTPGYGDQVNNENCLKPIDIVVLKKLSEVVNVVPVIAKSDSLTMEERVAFKRRIKSELAFHNIKLYPYDSDELDEHERALNDSIKQMIPFAIVGSEKNVVIDGKSVRGRRNRWGVINVENEQHCEFVHLRDFLTRTHLQDLIETTAQIHYEAFRSKQNGIFANLVQVDKFFLKK
ncbi:14504_t:CDS:10 [Cetraspora pellucida]|uniref:14504_t:CDS:1 n=1 Tax=Cetraspora pellucida TaxID=1433469 RepID=A0A9N9CIY9_9GLOM|nr:14504_t:CDS:10 [Cetraspora pellucida]